jgi:TRAP transporter TAXI family solute receptor
MYSRLFQLTIVGLLLSVAVPGYAQERIAYGTTRTQSSTYTYAVAAAKSINTVSGDKVSVTVISTGGAVDNLGRMSKGQIKLGLGNMASVYQAYNGIGKFKGKQMSKLRGLWLYQRSIQPYIVRQDSGISTLEGLQGKSWSAGQRGSATASIVSQTLDVLNIKPEYYSASLSDALKAIKDGRSVGYVKAMKGTSLDSATMELATKTPIKVLSFTDAQAAKVKEAFPYLSFVTVKDGDIQGVNGFRTWAAFSGHYTYSDLLDDDAVEAILKGIVDGKKHQDEVWMPLRGKDIIAMSLEGMNIPLHKGAVKFYRSRGYTVPDELVPPEMK